MSHMSLVMVPLLSMSAAGVCLKVPKFLTPDRIESARTQTHETQLFRRLRTPRQQVGATCSGPGCEATTNVIMSPPVQYHAPASSFPVRDDQPLIPVEPIQPEPTPAPMPAPQPIYYDSPIESGGSTGGSMPYYTSAPIYSGGSTGSAPVQYYQQPSSIPAQAYFAKSGGGSTGGSTQSVSNRAWTTSTRQASTRPTRSGQGLLGRVFGGCRN